MNIKLTALYDTLMKAYGPDTVKTAGTPQKLAEEIVAKVERWGDTVLVVSDICLLLATAWKLGTSATKVVYLPNTEADEKIAQSLARSNQKLRIGVLPVCYNDLNKIRQVIMAQSKFDVVVANPPYGNLHLPMMKMCVEHLSEDGIYLSVQPVRWLQDPLWKVKKSSDAKKMQPVLDGKLDSVSIVDSEQATDLFGARFNMDLAIFDIRNSGGNFEFSSLSQKIRNIDIHPFSHLLVDNGFRTDEFETSMAHFVPLALIYGGDDGSRPGKFVPPAIDQVYGYFVNGKSKNCKYGNDLTLEQAHKANKRRTRGKTIGAVVKSFDTAEEAKNFYDFIRLEAFRFFIYITTLDVNIQCKFLPFPKEADAFTTPWTNERFYAYHGIAPEQQAVIEETMKRFPLNEA